MAPVPRPPQPGLDKDVRRLQEQVRRLYTRRQTGRWGPWTDISSFLTADWEATTVVGDTAEVEYRTDGDMVFLRGLIECQTDRTDTIFVGLHTLGIAPAGNWWDLRYIAPLAFDNMALSTASVQPGLILRFLSTGAIGIEDNDPKIVDYTANPIAYKASEADRYANAQDVITLNGIFWHLT